MKNYHTHTARCGHAKGDDRDYVKKAIDSGITTLGFSDHAPMLFPSKDYYSNFRMYPEDARGYIESVKSLREEFGDKLKIHIDFEIEYLPELFEKTTSWLDSLGCEYYVLGQHFTDNEYEPYAHYCGSSSDSTELFDKYINQALAGLRTGKFLYIAHPDLFNFRGSEKIYEEKMTYFLKEIKSLGYPVEFNILGFMESRHYPNRRFWELVSKIGNDVVIGFDAHTPDVFTDKALYNRAVEYLAQLNITPIELEF